MRKLLPVALVTFAAAAPAVAQPNILFIIIDDLGVDKIGAYADDVPGYREDAEYLPATDTIDELAAVGVRFTRAWANPVCSPTRAGIMTGRHGFRTGVGSPVPSGPGLDLDVETTLPQILTDAAAGPEPYATGLFGKWHASDEGTDGTRDWTLRSTDGAHRDVYDTAPPIRAGFQEYSGWIMGGVPDYFSWYSLYADAEEYTSIDAESDYATWATVDDAVSWINDQSGPWFAMVSLNAAHADSVGTAYEEDDSDPSCRQVTCLDDGTCGNTELASLQGLAECADSGINDLLEGIPADVMADTLIVFVADNGSEGLALEAEWADLGTRPRGGKGTVYESGVRVPLIFADGESWLQWHGCTSKERSSGACTVTSDLIASPGRAVNVAAHTVDLFATLTSVAGFDQSTGDDSLDLTPCLTNTDRRCGFMAPRDVYTEVYEWVDPNASVLNLESGAAAITRGRYKLTATFDTTNVCLRGELYDMLRDPLELSDLVTTRTGMLDVMRTRMEGLAVPWMAGIPWCS